MVVVVEVVDAQVKNIFSIKIKIKVLNKKRYMYSPFYVFYDVISPAITNILKFVLLQDPVKIAIGVTLAYAFSKLVMQLNTGLITPLVKTFIRLVSKSEFKFTIKGVNYDFGGIIEQLIMLILVLIIIYYLIIVPVNKLKQKYNIDQQTLSCPFCTTLINPGATRCPSCTSDLKNVPPSSSEKNTSSPFNQDFEYMDDSTIN